MPLPPTQFRKRPVVITAVQWDGSNTEAVVEFGEGKVDDFDADIALTVTTLEGDLRLSKGDWLVKGNVGEYWPVRNDVFTASYEAV